jgi:HEAT repeat protein
MYHTNSKQLLSSGYQVASWLSPVLADHDNDFLAELLGSPYWSVRVGAALELGRRADRRATETLAHSFYHAAPSTRTQIVAALGEIADEGAIKLFVEVLEMAVDGSPLVRREVANALAAIARRESAPSAIWEALAGASDLLVWQALSDDDKAASDAAAIALAAIQGEEAIVMLKEFSDHSLGERVKVIDGLVAMKGELGAERIGAELRGALKERKAGVRLAALRGLLELREENKALQKGSGETLNDVRPTSYVQLLVRLGLERMKVQALAYKERKATADYYQLATQY